MHFYNAKHFGTIVYALAQTSIINLRDLLRETFGTELSDEITWQLLPLGLETPIDPIEYISGRKTAGKQNMAVRQFLAQIAASTQSLQSQQLDTNRLLTIFRVNIVSTKKIGNADLVVGVQGGADPSTGPLVVTKTMDPNITHPLRTMDVVASIVKLHGQDFTTGLFQAIAWKHGIKENPTFCWKSRMGELIRYSHETTLFIKRLTQGDIELAKTEYREKNRKKRVVPPVTASLPLTVKLD